MFMKLILPYVKKYKLLLTIDLISMMIVALAELGIPFFIGKMIDSGVQMQDPAVLWSIYKIMLVMAAIGLSSLIAGYWTSSKITASVAYDLRKDLFEHVMTLSHEEIRRVGVPSLITRTSSDAYQIMMFLNMMLRNGMFMLVLFAVSAALSMLTSMKMALIVLAGIPLIAAGAWIVYKVSGPLSQRQQTAIDRINAILRDNIYGIRVIRSLNNQQQEEKRFEKENGEYRNVSTILFKLMSMTNPMFFFLMNILTILLYYVAAGMIQNGMVQIGELIAFMEYLFNLMMSILMFCTIFTMFPKANVSAERIQEVLQLKSSIHPEQKGMEMEPVTSLEFDHVDFGYPEGKELILKDISFQAKAGQKIAIVGSTGSGKSSLGKLIPRFYDVTHGVIKINGCPIQEYSLKSLRDGIGYISQKPHIFSGTIEENIAFSKEDASRQDLEKAAALAQALSFIQERKEGFDDLISEEGTNLSGGQKQRLSIARALMKESGLYIFDDSFSALDFATDARLRKALAPVMKKSIFLIVAQRISTIRDADLIVVLDQGKMAGTGTHQELFEGCEVYREIVLSQMSEEEAGSYV